MKNFLLPQNSLQRRIMRRVWYSYGLSILVSKATVRGFALGFSAVLFVKLVSVPSVLANLLSVKVGAVPEYVWQIFMQSIQGGEILQLIALGVVIFSLLSFRINLRPTLSEGHEMQHV
jgi:hypothetical protein